MSKKKFIISEVKYFLGINCYLIKEKYDFMNEKII